MYYIKIDYGKGQEGYFRRIERQVVLYVPTLFWAKEYKTLKNAQKRLTEIQNCSWFKLYHGQAEIIEIEYPNKIWH